jgi:hypothetical protein
MLAPLPEDAPVTPLCVTVHEKVVPLTGLLNERDVPDPEQIDLLDATTVGRGLTLTLTTTGVPLHPCARGVIVYATVPVVEAVAVRVCVIVDPVPALAPDTLELLTVQLNVVPDTLLGLVMVIEVAWPEHKGD